MSFTVAGTLVAIIVVYLFFTKMDRAETLLLSLFTVNLLYEGFINVGYFIQTSGQVFKVSDFMQFVCVFLSLIILVKRGFKVGLVAFVAAVLMSVVMLLINPLRELVRTFNGADFVNNTKYMHYPDFDLQTVKTSVRLICFAVNGVAVAVCMSKERWHGILQMYLKMGRLIIVYAWIEFALKNILHVALTETLIENFFGSDTSIMIGLERNGLTVIIGLNNEPSQFSMMMYSYFLVYMVSGAFRQQTKAERNLTLSGIGLMMLCGSFRIVGMFPIMLVLYFVVDQEPAKSTLLISIVAALLIIFYTTGYLDYYLMRLERALLFTETMDATISGGEAGRLNTVVEAFGVFLKRPLFGIGPGQTFAYGFIPSILAMIGSVGTVAWYHMIFNTIGGVNKASHKLQQILIILIISISWIYTDSIAIGYSIYVIALALSLRYPVEAPRIVQTVQ